MDKTASATLEYNTLQRLEFSKKTLGSRQTLLTPNSSGISLSRQRPIKALPNYSTAKNKQTESAGLQAGRQAAKPPRMRRAQLLNACFSQAATL